MSIKTNRQPQSRREFLRATCVAGVSLGFLSRRWPGVSANDAPALPLGKRLIVRSAEPFNAEPVLADLGKDWITPLESFFVRCHAKLPQFDAGGFRLRVEGLVDRSLQLAAGELLERFPARKLTATLTCAGNRRSEFTGPKISGVPWAAGAIGNADWGGVSLATLLKHAGVQSGARHVWFEGLDQVTDKSETHPFGGSIPIEKALADTDRSPGTLLATHMNGKPLTAEHGAPLRAAVPGYVGARSVKWLTRIVVSDRPSPNHFLAHAYKVIAEDTPAALDAAPPLYEFALNSAICVPSADDAVSTGPLTVRGFALPTGAAGRTIQRVELSTDGGASWTAATIVSPVREYCWSLWSADVTIPRQASRLLARAVDSAGTTQPREMPWNVKGYQYNAWHQVQLKTS